MLVLIILLLASPHLGIESEYIRLDDQLEYYYKLLPGGRIYEISVFARHGEYFEGFLMSDGDFNRDWYELRDLGPPPGEYVVVNSTDNDVIIEHKSSGDSYLIFFRGEDSSDMEVNFEMHLFSAIALEYYWELIVLGFLGICCCSCCFMMCYVCVIFCLIYMRCCESTVRGCIWGRLKFLHRKSAEARRANALRKRLDRIKENQRLLPSNPEDMDVAHELKEVQPEISVETSSRARKFEGSDEESSTSSSSSSDDGVKIALIQEKEKVEAPKPKPKPKPKPVVQPAPQQPQNIQIHVALPQQQQQNPMMVHGQPMLMGHQPMMVGQNGNPVAVGGMVPNQQMGAMQMQQMMMQQMMAQGMMGQQMGQGMMGQQMIQPQQQQQPNIQVNTSSSSSVPVPTSPLPQKKVAEEVEPSAPALDPEGEISDDELLIIEKLEDDFQKSKNEFSSNSSGTDSDDSSD